MYAEFAEDGAVDAVDQVRVVVVAGDGDDVAVVRAEGEQGAHDQSLRLRARRRRLEQVTGNQHEVDVLGPGRLDEAGQHGFVLLMPIAALQHLADVPVAGVQDLQTRRPSRRRS